VSLNRDEDGRARLLDFSDILNNLSDELGQITAGTTKKC
jgi:hypothetical protein